jgi:hypothetical protein
MQQKLKKFHALYYHIVTFKDLQKLVHSQQSGPEQVQLLQILRDKPFWIWDQKQHKQEDTKTKGDCCFKHIIGYHRLGTRTLP